jgi:hemoglobin
MPSPSSGPDAGAIAEGVSLFLQRMVSDEFVSWAFEGVELKRVEKHARAIVVAALGGPDLYAGRDLTVVHTGLNLRDAHFDRAIDHLTASLVDVGISDSVILTLGPRLEPLRRQIVQA